MKKVIFIGYQPITSKVFSDFYIDACISKGLEVEYWDISYLYFPKINFENCFNFAGIKSIKSFRELKILLSLVEIKTTIFIINISFEFKVWKLFFLLSTFNCTLAIFGRGMYPTPEISETKKVLELVISFDFNRIINGVKNKLKKGLATKFKHYKIIKTYDVIFRAGSEGYKAIGIGNQLDLCNSRIIDVNYFDYDKYLGSIGEMPIIEKPYCVFLDEYLPYHPDIAITGIKTITADNYYPQLNFFFDFIEKKVNANVIIAAHPKAFKYKSENPFGGRTIIFNKSCELVKDAMFVMTHHSTSLSYPILFKKPLFFITSQAQKRAMPDLYKLTLYLGKSINCQVIHFDNFDAKQEFKKIVDLEKYDDYKYKYLTSKESENKPSSDIFIETISQL